MRAMVAVALLMCGAAARAEGAPTAAGPASAATPEANKIICRRTLETGSLVRKNKQCFTKAEWDRIYAVQREGNQKMVDGLSGRCGSPSCS